MKATYRDVDVARIELEASDMVYAMTPGAALRLYRSLGLALIDAQRGGQKPRGKATEGDNPPNRHPTAVLLGRALKVLREQAGMTQKAAKAQLGGCLRSLTGDEQGGGGGSPRGVSHERLGLYATLYEVTPRELLMLAATMDD